MRRSDLTTKPMQIATKSLAPSCQTQNTVVRSECTIRPMQIAKKGLVPESQALSTAPGVILRLRD